MFVLPLQPPLYLPHRRSYLQRSRVIFKIYEIFPFSVCLSITSSIIDPFLRGSTSTLSDDYSLKCVTEAASFGCFFIHKDGVQEIVND